MSDADLLESLLEDARKERDALTAQNARLREVLMSVSRQGPCWCHTAPAASDTPHDDHCKAAFSALAESPAAALDALKREVADPVYHERNLVVAALSKCFPSSIGFDQNEPDWPTVLIQLPTGQVSWHITADERHSAFAHIYDESGKWDGHDDAEKWRRLSALLAEARHE